MLAKLRTNFFAMDVLIVGYLLAFLFIILLSGLREEAQHTLSNALLFGGLGLGYLLLQRVGHRIDRQSLGGQKLSKGTKALFLLYLFSPLIVLPISFLSLGPVMVDSGRVVSVEEHPEFDPSTSNYDPDHSGENGYQLGPYGGATYYDHVLKNADIAVTGTYPPDAIRKYHTPFLSGVTQLGYLFYYIAPLCAVLPLLIAWRLPEFRIAASSIAGCLILTYFGYLLMPATGPRFEGGIEQWIPVEPGWFGAESIYRAIDAAESFRWNAFPSGHVAVSLTCVFVALRFSRRLGYALILPVLALCCATIYMGYHYFVDVIAGIACALISALALPPLIRWWEAPSGLEAESE